VADNPPREIQILIHNHINGFNTQNIDIFLGLFGDTAIIIDGRAPYRWLNPNAPANWLADVAKWRHELGVTCEHLAYEMEFWNVEGSDAYAVLAGTLTATIRAKPSFGPARSHIRFQSTARSGRSTHRRGGARRKTCKPSQVWGRKRPRRMTAK
jgi:hypothetical protein